jgi:hypothetical protein
MPASSSATSSTFQAQHFERLSTHRDLSGCPAGGKADFSGGLFLAQSRGFVDKRRPLMAEKLLAQMRGEAFLNFFQQSRQQKQDCCFHPLA